MKKQKFYNLPHTIQYRQHKKQAASGEAACFIFKGFSKLTSFHLKQKSLVS